MVGLDRGRQRRIARNKKARTGRASWVFRRLSETGLDSYLVEPGGFEPPSIPLTAGLSAFKLPFCCHFSKEACNSLQAS